MNNTGINMLGKVINQYRLVMSINNGAFGTVFRGEHIDHAGSFVAVKLLHSLFINSQEGHDSLFPLH